MASESGKACAGLDKVRFERKTVVGVDQRFVGDRVRIPYLILWK